LKKMTEEEGRNRSPALAKALLIQGLTAHERMAERATGFAQEEGRKAACGSGEIGETCDFTSSRRRAS
jgi:hypothetical protein